MPTEDAAVDLSFGLGGKVAVVTGGAAGIGAAIARAFVSKGARVVILDLDFEAAHAQAGKLGQNARAVACNVADPSSANDAVRAVLAEFGRVDILVNCAGVVFLAPAEDLTPEQWDITLGVNLKGTFLMSQHIGRAMAWLADRPAVASVIIGARSAGQLKDSLGAAGLHCPPGRPHNSTR
jgi:NAD(P)-dependent dehydrogenase (short-subunit alcohol dehydrogenase family)